MDDRNYGISLTLGHQGRSLKHNRTISKIIRDNTLPEVYQSRNEWLSILRPFIDHDECRYIVSNRISLNGSYFSEIIQLYPPHSHRAEFSFFLHTEGMLEFADQQSTIEYKDLNKQLMEYLPSASFKISQQQRYVLVDAFQALLKSAKEKHLDFRIGGVTTTNKDSEGITLSFKERSFKQATVKFGAVVVPLGRPAFNSPKS